MIHELDSYSTLEVDIQLSQKVISLSWMSPEMNGLLELVQASITLSILAHIVNQNEKYFLLSQKSHSH